MSDTYIALDVKQLEIEINRLIADYPELAEDEALRADTVEGQTDLHSVLSRILDHRSEALEMVTGIKERASHLKERQDRYERRADALKALAFRLMNAADQSKITLTEATLSISKGRDSVVIDDIDSLPQGTYSVEKKPNKDAIKKQIEAGSPVPGARIEQGQPSLVVRAK